MKIFCNTVRDLLPLYLDNVCSLESREIVEDHLEICPNCREYLTSLQVPCEQTDMPKSSEYENKKISSFREVRHKIVKKQAVSVLLTLLLVIIILFITIGYLKKSSDIVLYDDNLSVSMIDGNLVGRLYGSEAEKISIKRVSSINDGKNAEYLFYVITDTKWSDLITSDKMFSEYTLCAKDKGAEQVDFVYYYTGSLKGIESLDGSELQNIIKDSVLLWKK